MNRETRYPYNVVFPTPDNPWPLIGGGFDGPPSWRGGKCSGGNPEPLAEGDKVRKGKKAAKATRRDRIRYDGTLELVAEVLR